MPSASTVTIARHRGLDSSELDFEVGEVVVVHTKEGDWWFGTIEDRRGWFPASFVQPLHHAPTETTPPALTPAANADRHKPFVALFDHAGTEEDELTFNEGDLIMVAEHSPDGWGFL